MKHVFTTVTAIVALLSTTALAGEPKQAPGASSKNEIEQPGEPATDDDEDIETATPDPTPKPVEPGNDLDKPVVVDVVEQAGVGGPVPYGAASVLEVGGYGSVSASADQWLVRLRPQIGWFVSDGVKLSYSNDILIGQNAGEDLRLALTAIIEQSFHIPLGVRSWLAVGMGGGVLYNGETFGGILTPRVGLDIMVGRSGVLHFSTVLSVSSIALFSPTASKLPPSNNISVGFDIGYGVMF